MTAARVAMTLPASGLAVQRPFHLQAGVATIVDPSEADGLDADWVLRAQPGEFWWPRGGTLADILTRVPDAFDAVQAVPRPLVAAAGSDAFVYRVPADAQRHARRLVVRSGGQGSRPLTSWYPIELLTYAGTLPQAEIEDGLAKGVVQLDTRVHDALAAIEAGGAVEFPRPSVADNALFAADVSALGEGDGFRLRDDLAELERRVTALEQRLTARAIRKVHSVLRRGGST